MPGSSMAVLEVTHEAHLGPGLLSTNAPEGPAEHGPRLEPVVPDADIQEGLRQIHIALLVLHTDLLVLQQDVRGLQLNPTIVVTPAMDPALLDELQALRAELAYRSLGAILQRLWLRIKSWWS